MAKKFTEPPQSLKNVLSIVTVDIKVNLSPEQVREIIDKNIYYDEADIAQELCEQCNRYIFHDKHKNVFMTCQDCKANACFTCKEFKFSCFLKSNNRSDSDAWIFCDECW